MVAASWNLKRLDAAPTTKRGTERELDSELVESMGARASIIPIRNIASTAAQKKRIALGHLLFVAFLSKF